MFITRINIAPDSKTLLTEMMPYMAENIDALSFVPKDVADKYEKSGYVNSKVSFISEFRENKINKYVLATNQKTLDKVFGDKVSSIDAKVINDANIKKTNRHEIEDVLTLEDELDVIYKSIQDAIDSQRRILKSKNADDQYIEKANELAEILEDYEDVNQIRGVVAYLKNVYSQVNNLERYLSKPAKDVDEMRSMYSTYRDYLTLFSSINDIKELLDKSTRRGEFPVSKDVSNLLTHLSSSYDSAQNHINTIAERYIRNS